MNKVMAFAIAVSIAVFGGAINTTATESKIQDNHHQHHKAANAFSKSDKNVAIKKKKSAVPKRRTVRLKKRGGVARKS